ARQALAKELAAAVGPERPVPHQSVVAALWAGHRQAFAWFSRGVVHLRSPCTGVEGSPGSFSTGGASTTLMHLRRRARPACFKRARKRMMAGVSAGNASMVNSQVGLGSGLIVTSWGWGPSG